MPFVHVKPDCSDPLQGIADSLWKSRKVVVVTGAGISTNSGIPDFRSEHGLYSMIQEQFDAASKVADLKPFGYGGLSETSSEDEGRERPTKRRRISASDHRIFPNLASRGAVAKVAEMECIVVRSEAQGPSPAGTSERERDALRKEEEKEDVQGASTSPDSTIVESDSPSMSTAQTIVCASTCNSPASNGRPPDRGIKREALVGPLEGNSSTSTSTSTPKIRTPISSRPPSRLHRSHFPLSSSPLSSPPPILFDPYDDSSIIVSSSPTSRDSYSESETEDTPPSSQSVFGSQLSNSSRSTLPNLKGRDLLDVSIWSDPLKTSVFYAFTTTLRQKARDSTPTGCHYFISHLRDTGKLVRCYTQNIDQMEEKVGLSTELSLGPGSRGRFSTRSARSSAVASSGDLASNVDTPGCQDQGRRGCTTPNRGAECVYLHGSLHALRCFQCGQISNWDDDGREPETLSGRQPTCPHCEGATAARQERGKRALGIGKLRPDIVLYGEEHPNADLISPIVQHDLSLAPDMLLILGTSLKVHGLKVMVREFAKAVHNKGGKVVFVNYTKPAESTWSDIIDYWVQWDCDAWVEDLKERKPVLWLPPGATVKPDPKPASKKKQEKQEKEESRAEPKTERPKIEKPKLEKLKVEKPEPKRPMAIRDDKVNGAYLVCKILRDLGRISGRASMSEADLYQTTTTVVSKPKRARKSAPAVLGSKPNPDALEIQRAIVMETSIAKEAVDSMPSAAVAAAVKTNPRIRKRKTIFGDEPAFTHQPQERPPVEGEPKPKRKRASRLSSILDDKENIPSQQAKPLISTSPIPLPDMKRFAGLALPPLRNIDKFQSSPLRTVSSPFPRPTPLEPSPVTTGPLSTISPNVIGRWTMEPPPRTPSRPTGISAATLARWKDNPFFFQDALASYLRQPPPPAAGEKGSLSPTEQLLKEEEAAITLSVLRGGSRMK